MKQGDTVFVSATATGLGKDKKAVIDKIECDGYYFCHRYIYPS